MDIRRKILLFIGLLGCLSCLSCNSIRRSLSPDPLGGDPVLAEKLTQDLSLGMGPYTVGSPSQLKIPLSWGQLPFHVDVATDTNTQSAKIVAKVLVKRDPRISYMQYQICQGDMQGACVFSKLSGLYAWVLPPLPTGNYTLYYQACLETLWLPSAASSEEEACSPLKRQYFYVQEQNPKPNSGTQGLQGLAHIMTDQEDVVAFNNSIDKGHQDFLDWFLWLQKHKREFKGKEPFEGLVNNILLMNPYVLSELAASPYTQNVLEHIQAAVAEQSDLAWDSKEEKQLKRLTALVLGSVPLVIKLIENAEPLGTQRFQLKTLKASTALSLLYPSEDAKPLAVLIDNAQSYNITAIVAALIQMYNKAFQRGLLQELPFV